MILSSLIVKLGLDAGSYDRELSKAERNLRTFGGNMDRIGQGLTLGVTVPIIGMGAAALQAAGKMEQSTTAFTTLLGSADKARSMLKDLQQFALKTPFEFQDLQSAAKRMMALGFAAKDIIPMLRTVGDAVSALGGGSEMIDRVTLAIGQMQAKGKVSAQEMNQLAEAGIPGWEMLAKKIGVSIPEAMKMAEQGAISSAVAIPAILEGMNAKFAGGMEAQSKTLLGQLSNVKDQIFATLTEVGNSMLPAAKNITENFVSPVLKGIAEVAKGFNTLPDSVKGLIGTGVLLAASIGPTAWGLGKLSAALLAIQGIFKGGIIVTAISTLARVVSPIAIVITAVTLSIVKAVEAWGLLKKEWGNDKFLLQLRGRFKEIEDAHKNVLGNFAATPPAFALDKSAGEAAKVVGSLGFAFANLGLVSTKQLSQELTKAKDSLAIITEAFKKGEASALDVARAHDAVKEAQGKLTASTDVLTSSTHAIPFKEKTLEGRMLVAEYERLIDVQSKLVSDIVKNRAIVAAGAHVAFPVPPELMVPPSGGLDMGGISMQGASERTKQLGDMADKLAEIDRISKASRPPNLGTVIFWEGIAQKITKTGEAMKHVRQHVHQLSRSLGDAIVRAESLGDVFKRVAQSIASSLISIVIEKGINKVINALGGLTGSLAGIFGSAGGGIAKAAGGGLASAGAGQLGQIGGIAGSLGGAGSSAGSAAGAAAGMGVSAAVGMATGIISSISGVVGNFQMKGINKTLDLIEKEVRESKIYLFTLVGRANEFWPKLPAIIDYFYEHQITALAELIDAVRANGRGGSGNNFNFYLSGSAKDQAEAFVRELKSVGVKVG